ncbi:Neoverrucotoxin subunit alpha [Larimichthys crocea]|uniref:Neoverrucotoxin subunit alpha n=1 Tax=Larimichthys crocea TaxID=215358 RepID=A0A6G0HX93_LARCR|nr:Neoverrucotoxin subunit alpha [Larimichthys crocea]
MASENMKIAALGRPFTLGMLYDARKDKLIAGVTLWDGKTLQENTLESSQHSSAFQISASDSIESKSSLLDVEASLKASFLGGLIEVGGSAKYLNDTKKFKNQSRVTCHHDKLSEWLDHKEREINIIRFCVGMMEGAEIVHSQSELDREVLAAGVEHAVCFVFTSLESADPCFDEMNNYVDTLMLGSTTEVPWYYADEVLTKMREKAEEVHNLAKALKNFPQVRFFIASIANEKYTGATIYHYKDGILVTDDFTKPEIPPVRRSQTGQI